MWPPSLQGMAPTLCSVWVSMWSNCFHIFRLRNGQLWFLVLQDRRPLVLTPQLTYGIENLQHYKQQRWTKFLLIERQKPWYENSVSVLQHKIRFCFLSRACTFDCVLAPLCFPQAQGILTLPYECAGPEHGSYRWPYIVVELCYGQTLRTIDDEDWMGLQPNHVVWPHVARWLGHTLRTVHSLPSSVALSQNSAQSHAGAGSNCYTRFLGDLRRTCISRHLRHWNIPDHLWLQMGQFLPSEDAIRWVV